MRFLPTNPPCSRRRGAFGCPIAAVPSRSPWAGRCCWLPLWWPVSWRGRPPRRPISPPRACPLRFRTRSAPTGWAATCSCARWPAFPPACSWASWRLWPPRSSRSLAAAAALGPRWADHAVSWLIDLMMGIPHIVLLILISYALGKGFWGVTIGVALTHWPSLARILRAEILQCASSDFVAAAARLGAGRLAIAARHMGPQPRQKARQIPPA